MLTKAGRVGLYFLFLIWYIPLDLCIAILGCYMSVGSVCKIDILYLSFSLYHILLYLFSFLSISSLSQCCPAVWNPLDAQPNRILLVTIHHVLYPITVDVLYQVFSPHGSVEKIVTFQKSAGQILSDFSLSLLSFPFKFFSEF